MRVIPTACPDTNAALLDAFRHHLADRDLAPATVHAYLSDLTRFQAWLTWVHEDQAPLLIQVRTVDLAVFRTYLIHEQGHPPATVNRRLQGLPFRWLVDCNWMIENPTTHLRFMRKSGTPQPLALRRREVFALFHAAAASPHKLALRNVALVQLMGPSRVAGGRGDRPYSCGSDPEDPGGHRARP
jgi:site-specific recombinase XerD